MKRLVCANDMEAFVNSGKKTFFIEEDVILTPSAKDIAKNNGIEFTTKKVNEKEIENLDGEKILDIFKAMINEGLLQEILKTLTNANSSKCKDGCI